MEENKKDVWTQEMEESLDRYLRSQGVEPRPSTEESRKKLKASLIALGYLEEK